LLSYRFEKQFFVSKGSTTLDLTGVFLKNAFLRGLATRATFFMRSNLLGVTKSDSTLILSGRIGVLQGISGLPIIQLQSLWGDTLVHSSETWSLCTSSGYV